MPFPLFFFLTMAEGFCSPFKYRKFANLKSPVGRGPILALNHHFSFVLPAWNECYSQFSYVFSCRPRKYFLIWTRGCLRLHRGWLYCPLAALWLAVLPWLRCGWLRFRLSACGWSDRELEACGWSRWDVGRLWNVRAMTR